MRKFLLSFEAGKTKCDVLIKRNVIFSRKTKCNKIKNAHSTKEVDLIIGFKSTSFLYIEFKLHFLMSIKQLFSVIYVILIYVYVAEIKSYTFKR